MTDQEAFWFAALLMVLTAIPIIPIIIALMAWEKDIKKRKNAQDAVKKKYKEKDRKQKRPARGNS